MAVGVVVTRDVPPRTVVSGVSAKVIKFLGAMAVSRAHGMRRAFCAGLRPMASGALRTLPELYLSWAYPTAFIEGLPLLYNGENERF